MKKNTSNSDKISENHISGINRVVKLDIVIDGKPISHFKHFRLHQSAKTHHRFELTLAHDSLGEAQNHTLEQAKQFFGKRLTITFKYKDPENESPERTFVGVIMKVAFSQEKMSLGNIVLKGNSPTILMDSAPHTQSFGGGQPVNTSIIAERIIKESLGTNNFDFRIDTQNKGYINYSSQYCETHYNYLARIAEAYGEQFYCDGEVLHFGKLPPHEKSIKLIDGSNVSDVKIELNAVHIKPEYFGYNSSNHTKMIGVDNQIKHLGELSSETYELNNNIFKTRSLTPAPVNPNMFLDIDDSQKSARGSKAVDVFTVSGKTTVPFLYTGCVADLAMRKPDSNQTSHFTTLMITEVNHEVDARGYYTGNFEAIAEGTGFMPKPDFIMPKAEPQVATVISNADPLNQGRIQVRFDWQLNDTTHFIRMMSPDAGGTDAISQNRGFVAVPEIGDQVMVGFEYHNPDFPFAMGGMFHGNVALGGGINNHLKSIQTRSGIKVLMNDANGSVTIQDPSGNIYFMDGDGNINITAPNKITMNATDIQMNAYNNLEMNVSNNIIINAMSKFFVFTPYMKNVVSGFMGFFSGKALFNSGSTLDIEAKEAKLHGIDKMVVHSDKQAIINSKGTAEMYGENGNQLSNKAKKIPTVLAEQIAKAIVHFRVKTGWNGEYGFDWLREKDNGLAPVDDPAYEDTIEGGYKDGITDLTGGASGTAYTQLKTQYSIIPISRKPLPVGTPAPAITPPAEYFVPYLTLFSKDFVDAMPATITNKPKYEAELKVLVEIEEDIDKLEFEYDKKTFIIDKPILKDKTKTAGLVNSADATVKITCLKALTADKEIKIYAYAKGSKQPLVDRKLAGKIIVLKNDSTVRKEEKFVLIPIKTNITGVARGNKIGGFTSQEKENFCNTFYQALTIPIIEENPSIILDLSANPDYKAGGRFIKPGNLVWEDAPNFFSETQSLFLNAKDAAGNLINTKYSGYFTVFSLAEQVYDGAKGQIASNQVTAGGKRKTVFLKNLIIFPNKDFYTMNHEGLHGFNLRHTHRDSTPIDEPNAKYIFPSSDVDFNKSTTNVMCYRDIAYSTWRWQWHIINSNISEK